jgi:hypothetical protein
MMLTRTSVVVTARTERLPGIELSCPALPPGRRRHPSLRTSNPALHSRRLPRRLDGHPPPPTLEAVGRPSRAALRPRTPSPARPSHPARVPYGRFLPGRDGSWPLRLPRAISAASLLWMGSLTGGCRGVSSGPQRARQTLLARQAEMSGRRHVCTLRGLENHLRKTAFILSAGGVLYTGEMALQVAGLRSLAPARGWAACGGAEALLRGTRTSLLWAAGRKTGRRPVHAAAAHRGGGEDEGGREPSGDEHRPTLPARRPSFPVRIHGRTGLNAGRS